MEENSQGNTPFWPVFSCDYVAIIICRLCDRKEVTSQAIFITSGVLETHMIFLLLWAEMTKVTQCTNTR